MEVNNSEIMVSVFCITYNHEKYIRDALEGFVNQKTDFKYEVLVHDDASTDNTALIIREYAQKYPELIFPIFEKENQYSKDINIITALMYPLIRGKYVAICEGDDYWCDENKLQRQVDFLEKHDDFSACTHSTEIWDYLTGQKRIYHPVDKDVEIKIEDIILGNDKCFQTASVMYRKRDYIMPDFFYTQSGGDYQRAIWSALCGKIYYFKEVMSIYRANLPGSWTATTIGEKREKCIQIEKELIQKIDSYTNGKYHIFFVKKIRINEFKFLEKKGEYKKIMREYKDIYREIYSPWQRFKLIIKAFFPKLFMAMMKIYK